ncbi:unnamed protein product [Brachionus calyciflorus]|uniref:5-aminolevulinate synthase n=1 Tax=Brachionus calyciflorus TaxID=104777 RepID=A0A814JPZ6_9BILA|nr:unnamed protein product [Brachionus calyciflorus]
MLLKCRYLSQFSMSELTKNAVSISNSMDKCPFMLHARRTMTSTSTPMESAHKNLRKENEPNSKLSCTNTINCPFFKQAENLDLNHLIKKQFDTELHDGHMKTKKIKMEKKSLDENHELFSYDKFFSKKIDDKKKDGSYRYFKKVIRHAETFPKVQEYAEHNVKDITIWCSNDYLGLGRHPYVQSKVSEAVWKYGAGSGGTRNISGSTPLHYKLEDELASLHQKESALLFTSCYVANDTTLYTLARMLPKCHILSDEGNHASMIQGIRNSGIPKTIFRHNDCEHLEEILQRLPRDTPKIVAFESVHSMDGSICDLHRMCDITHKYGGIAYIDEVHAVGLYGNNGAGIGERDSALEKMDIITGTLGKAFGNIGGYIAGSANLIDTIRSYGSGFIFTTSLPPSVLAGSLASIEISRSDEGRELRAKHQLYAHIVKERLLNAGFPVMDSPSHIVPVMVGDVKAASEICNRLLEDHGIYIQAINYPTVARGTERLRIVPNPHHTMEMIDQLVDALISTWTKSGLKLKN